MTYPTVYPTGATVYLPERCWSGYTIFQAKAVGAFLIDMNGREVRLWKELHGFPNRLLPGGYVLGHTGERNTNFGMQDYRDLLQWVCSEHFEEFGFREDAKNILSRDPNMRPTGGIIKRIFYFRKIPHHRPFLNNTNALMFEGLPHIFEKGNGLTDSSMSATESAKHHRKMSRFFWRSRQVCGTMFLPLQKFHYGLGAKTVVDWRTNEN